MSAPAFPRLRWAALLWVALYLPSYAAAYGFANFLFLCNLGLFVTALGLWTGSAFLLSSQALGMLAVSLAWTADLVSRLLTGTHWIGGTEYMWDPKWPLPTRLLSLYHAAVPCVLVYALRRVGYDPRGYRLQAGLAVAGVLVARMLGPEANVNHAFVDAILKRSFEPAPLHVLVIAGALVLVVYPLTHLVLARALPRKRES